MARTPSLSVIIACCHPGPDTDETVARLLAECRSHGAICWLIDGSRNGLADSYESRFPDLRGCRAPADTLVPALWTRGIQACESEIVVLTITDCRPCVGWLDAVAQAPWGDLAALGGSFVLPPDARAHDGAVFALRFGRYAATRGRREVDDIAADNAAYRRDLLEGLREHWSAGFWEHFLNRQLRAAGHRLLFEPKMAVEFRNGAPHWAMIRARFSHGRRYAFDRMKGAPRQAAALRAFLAPALVPLLLGRSLAQMRANRQHGVVRVFPSLLAYIVAWSAGELAGYLSALSVRSALRGAP